MFSQCQILSVITYLPFKNHLITHFSFSSHCNDRMYLPVRQMGKQEVLILYNWILVTSLEISNESIKYRYKQHFISNNLDGLVIGLENFKGLEKWLWVGEDLEVKIHGKRLNEMIS